MGELKLLDYETLVEYPKLALKDGVVILDSVIRDVSKDMLRYDNSRERSLRVRELNKYIKVLLSSKGIVKGSTVTVFSGGYIVGRYDQYVDELNKVNVGASKDGLSYIISFSKESGITILTSNLNLINRCIKSKTLYSLVDKSSLDDMNYTGIKEIDVSTEEGNIYYNKVVESHSGNYETSELIRDLDLYENQYILFKRGSEYENDCYIVTGGQIEKVDYSVGRIGKVGSGKTHGEIKYRNKKQLLAMDLLSRRYIPVKVIKGKYGSGKDFLMLNKAVELIDHGVFNKIVFVRNNVNMEDVNEIGFLPNGLEDKMRPYVKPLIDICGGDMAFDQIFDIGLDDRDPKFEVTYLGHVKGRSWDNSIIYVTEAEDLTPKHIRLIISRAGEGTEVWINGDEKQVESIKYEFNNAINEMSRLKGDGLVGIVTLDKIERSRVANLADKFD